MLSLSAAVSLFYTIFFRHSDGGKKREKEKRKKRFIRVGRKLAAYSRTRGFSFKLKPSMKGMRWVTEVGTN